MDKELDFKILVQQDNNIVGQFKPDPGSNYFKGHFPGYPIVPGVLLLEVSLRVLAVALGVPRPGLNVKSLKKISFLKPVFPNDHVKINLVTGEDETRITGFTNGEMAFRFIAGINHGHKGDFQEFGIQSSKTTKI